LVESSRPCSTVGRPGVRVAVMTRSPTSADARIEGKAGGCPGVSHQRALSIFAAVRPGFIAGCGSYRAGPPRQLRPNREVILACQQTGRRVAIISRNSQAAVEPHLQLQDLAEHVDVIVGRTDPEGRASPRRRCRRHRDQHRRAARSPGRPPAVIHLALPGASCEQPSWREPRSPTTPRVERSGRTVLACPTPSRKRVDQPTPHLAGHGRRPSCVADFVGCVACPGALLACPGNPPSPGSKGRAGRPARHLQGPHQGGAVHQTDDCGRPARQSARSIAYQATTVPAMGQLALEAQPALLHHPPRGGVGGHGGADPSPSRPLLNCRPAATISLVTCDDQDDAEPGPEASSASDAGSGTWVKEPAAFQWPALVQRCLTSRSISCDTATAVPSSPTARQVPTTGPWPQSTYPSRS
jgi:hypothetical protein